MNARPNNLLVNISTRCEAKVIRELQAQIDRAAGAGEVVGMQGSAQRQSEDECWRACERWDLINLFKEKVKTCIALAYLRGRSEGI